MIAAVGRYFSQLAEWFGREWNRFWFTPADPLPLAVIRLLTGAIALYWYLTLAPDLQRLFGANGWLPTDAIRQLEGNAAPYLLSYFNYVQGPGELWSVFVVGALVLAAFAAGWWTRLTAPLALVVVLSTVHRAPVVSTQLESLLTLVMFYLALGPSGACLSVDAWRNARRVPSLGTVPSVPSGHPSSSLAAGVVIRLLQVHLAMLYACMGLSKLMAESWWTGSAVWSLMTRSDSRLVDFTWLYSHPFIVNYWTHAIVFFQLAFAILIWNRWLRPLLLAFAVVMWCSVTLLTGQITFLLMILTANLAYFPSSVFREIPLIKAAADSPADPAG